MKRASLIAGLGFGDEGKGSTVDWLTRRQNAKLVVRYNGGAQAAHHVVLPDGRWHCFAQFGSGTFAGARTHLSRFMLVNPVTMLSEARHLQEVGITDPMSLVTVEDTALVTTPFHIAANRLKEIFRGDGKHGSCGMGIGETMEDSLEGRVTLRVGDLRDMDRCRALLQEQQKNKIQALQVLFPAPPRLTSPAEEREWDLLCHPHTVDRTLKAFAQFTKQVNIVDSGFLDEELRKDQVIIFEGAQGALLDQDYGFQPHTTWTDITFKNAMTLLGDRYDGEVSNLGIMRAFQTRHGAGPMPSEDAQYRHWVSHDHNQKNEWQDSFRVGPLDLVLTKYALDVLGDVDSLIVTNLDRLHGLDTIAVCTGHLRRFPNGASAERLRIAVNQPATMSHQEQVTRTLLESEPVLTQVPQADFIDFVSEYLGTKVYMKSFGPTHVDKRIHWPKD